MIESANLYVKRPDISHEFHRKISTRGGATARAARTPPGPTPWDQNQKTKPRDPLTGPARGCVEPIDSVSPAPSSLLCVDLQAHLYSRLRSLLAAS